MPYLRAFAFVFALAGTLAFLAPVQWLARRYHWRIQRAIQTGFSRTMCAIIGIRVQAHGRLAGEAPRFVVANHVSWTDILALSSLYPLVFLAKSEVASWPALGFLARLQGSVFVERAHRRAIPKVNEALLNEMRAGHDLVVFAEGTSSDGSRVLRFNPAHFAAASDPAPGAGRSVEVTLAPVAIVYTEPGAKTPHGAPLADVGWYGDMTFVPHLWGLMKRGGARCHLLFGEAIAVEGRDRKALAAATEASVRKLMTGEGA